LIFLSFFFFLAYSLFFWSKVNKWPFPLLTLPQP
jgi:hypothetical protein